MRPLHAIAVCCGFAVLVMLISLCQSAEPSHFVADANPIIRICPSTNPSKSPQTIMTIPRPIMTALQTIILIFTASSQSSIQWWFTKTVINFYHSAAEIRGSHPDRPPPKPDWFIFIQNMRLFRPNQLHLIRDESVELVDMNIADGRSYQVGKLGPEVLRY